MHDLLLAKQISDLVDHLTMKHELKTVQKVSIELGDVSGIHHHEEHLFVIGFDIQLVL